MSRFVASDCQRQVIAFEDTVASQSSAHAAGLRCHLYAGEYAHAGSAPLQTRAPADTLAADLDAALMVDADRLMTGTAGQRRRRTVVCPDGHPDRSGVYCSLVAEGSCGGVLPGYTRRPSIFFAYLTKRGSFFGCRRGLFRRPEWQ